jgi:uncharacterized protein YjbK
MRQEMEIEFKNLLTKEEFERLKQTFRVDEQQFVYQENHYLDTAQFSLKNQGAALRIRVKGETYTLTLKQTAAQGLHETHETLTKEEAKAILHDPASIQGGMRQLLQTLGVSPGDLRHFGTLATYRAHIAYEGGVLVLDHSHYLQTDDYELEYEVNDWLKGKETFSRLLASLNIPIRPTANKIKRLYIKKYGVEENG